MNHGEHGDHREHWEGVSRNRAAPRTSGSDKIFSPFPVFPVLPVVRIESCLHHRILGLIVYAKEIG